MPVLTPKILLHAYMDPLGAQVWSRSEVNFDFFRLLRVVKLTRALRMTPGAFRGLGVPVAPVKLPAALWFRLKLYRLISGTLPNSS